MNEAPVGFHCPDDAAQARRLYRPPRTAVGALVRVRTPWVTWTLIAINVAAYAITGVQSRRGFNDPAAVVSTHSVFYEGTLQPLLVHADGSYWRLLTAAFLHLSLLHLGANMISLYFVGPAMEQVLGGWRFLALYLASALGGSVAVYVFDDPRATVVGASGAIFGLLGACLDMVRKIGLNLQWLVTIIVLNFVFTFSVAGISRLGHLGGFVTGALLGLALAGLPTRRRVVSVGMQVAGISAVVLVLIVLVIARSATISA
jgi:membrane associated rhomboid family serine protease